VTRFTDNNGAEWSFEESDRIGDPSGMGAVFRGAGADGTPVAIKRVRLAGPDLGDERRRARELEIGQILLTAARSGEDTTHLVLPLGYAFAGADLYLVLPLADESLAHALAAGPSTPAAGAEVLRQIALGLESLAAMSIVHRDLKPANVLRYGDTWKITDFGIARDLSVRTDSYTLAAYRTKQYTAPEIWRGQPANAKSDLYALGVLGFEALTGGLPFTGPQEGDFRRQHLDEPPPALDGVPPRLARLVLRLLAKAAADRPRDARDVRETIEGLAPRLRANQEELASAALDYEQRRMRAEAAASVRSGERQQAADERRQALGDLDRILADADDDIREALPDARLDRAARRVEVGGLRLAFETSEPLRLTTRPEDNRSVLVGVVRPEPAGDVCAHLVYAPRSDGRPAWFFHWPRRLDADRLPLDADAVLEILRVAIVAAEPGDGR